MNITFQNWQEAHPFIKDYLFYPKNEEGRWARVRAEWKEKKANERSLLHLCAFTIDLETGNLYTDCSKLKIWVKCVLLCLGRPYFGLLKTVYHLILPFSIPVEIFKAVIKGIQQEQSSDQIFSSTWRHIKHSIADIIRTPVYTVAMTVIMIAATIIGPFAPSKLYDWRELAGCLESRLNREEERLTVAPCFQPIGNLMNLDQDRYYEKADTEYEDEPTLHGLNNLARSYVRFHRENCDPFHCGRLQSEKQPYVSPVCDNS